MLGLLILVVIVTGFLALCIAWVRAVRRARRLVRVFEAATPQEQEWLRQKTEDTQLGWYLLPIPWWHVLLCLLAIAALLGYHISTKL